MRSSLVKHLWLIQPNDHHSPVLPLDAAGGATVHFSPAWDLLCLRAFILERTGHTCELIDARCHAHVHDAFAGAEANASSDAAIVAVIYAATANLGSVGAIARYLKKHHPTVPVAIFGPHVNAFPETLFLIPGIDYGLYGDPEPKLRHLLDALDIPHRLKLMPGLLMPGTALRPASWMNDLRGLSLPDWQSLDWLVYQHDPASVGSRIEARLTRGNPGTPADAAWPGAQEPLRIWPMDRMAQALQKCPGSGIDEVFLNDPPGFWTDQRLFDWMNHLKRLGNTQPWSFQIIARTLPVFVISELALSACHRIQLIVPTLDVKRQPLLGMTISDTELKQLIDQLRSAGVDPQIVFWIEGPWQVDDEPLKIAEQLRMLGRPSYAVYLFPFHIDSALYRRFSEEGGQAPRLDEWIAWAQRDDSEPPAELWAGAPGISRAKETMKTLTRRIARDPRRMLQKFVGGGNTSLRRAVEERALAAWHRFTSKNSAGN